MLLVNVFFCFLTMKAQNGSQITGKVVDALGELPGVSVVVKGTTNGTTTDLNGVFKLFKFRKFNLLISDCKN